MLIDVSVPGDRNVIKKEAEKILNIKTLQQKYSACGMYIAKVISVIISATGTTSISFRKYQTNKPGREEIKELRKTAILGTSHTAGSADVKVQNI